MRDLDTVELDQVGGGFTDINGTNDRNTVNLFTPPPPRPGFLGPPATDGSGQTWLFLGPPATN